MAPHTAASSSWTTGSSPMCVCIAGAMGLKDTVLANHTCLLECVVDAQHLCAACQFPAASSMQWTSQVVVHRGMIAIAQVAMLSVQQQTLES